MKFTFSHKKVPDFSCRHLQWGEIIYASDKTLTQVRSHVLSEMECYMFNALQCIFRLQRVAHVDTKEVLPKGLGWVYTFYRCVGLTVYVLPWGWADCIRFTVGLGWVYTFYRWVGLIVYVLPLGWADCTRFTVRLGWMYTFKRGVAVGLIVYVLPLGWADCIRFTVRLGWMYTFKRGVAVGLIVYV